LAIFCFRCRRRLISFIRLLMPPMVSMVLSEGRGVRGLVAREARQKSRWPRIHAGSGNEPVVLGQITLSVKGDPGAAVAGASWRVDRIGLLTAGDGLLDCVPG
jgi:hypothetical protein